MTFGRPRFARPRSLGGASLRSAGRPRFVRRDGLASLGGTASLSSAEPRWSLASLGGTASLRSAGGASLRFARLEASENGTPSGEPSGGLYPPLTERCRTDLPLKFSGLLVVWFHQRRKKLLLQKLRFLREELSEHYYNNFIV